MRSKRVTLVSGMLLVIWYLIGLAPPAGATAAAQDTRRPSAPIQAPAPMFPCVAFSPYVEGYDAETGPHPPPELIDQLLDEIRRAGFHCIMTYGVLHGLDHTIEAAAQRDLQVIAILWLDEGDPANASSIQRGIELDKAYPQTIIRLSCGSEFRTRYGTEHDETLVSCITQLRSAGVTQPITSIDTWWEWCNRAWPCQPRELADDVDWIGINVFPWWENKYSGLFPCTPADKAATFNLDRLQEVRARYPGKEVVVTEFGWPGGPAGYAETNQRTGQQCGIAGAENQRRVVEETLERLDELGLPGVVFSAFREAWKVAEGAVGPYWGICDGTAPYECPIRYGLRERLNVPLLGRQ